jgi:hypothetical protein
VGLLRGLLFLRSPTRLDRCYQPCAAFGTHLALLLAGALRSARFPLDGGSRDEGAGLLKAGDFGIDKSENLGCAHADECSASRTDCLGSSGWTPGLARL